MTAEQNSTIPSHLNNTVSSAFDTAANSYDKSFNENPVTQVLRQKIYNTIESRIHPGSSILDLNCGTGTDTIYFGKRGMSVTGIDVSERMISECDRKLEATGLKNIAFHVCSIENLKNVVTLQFDLVLSNFGGLNCIADLSSGAKQISDYTKQGGYFVAVVMPGLSFWETVTGILRLKFKYAFRRFQKKTYATGFGDTSFEVHYYSPYELASYFQSSFSIESITGLNIFSPPPSSSGFFLRHPIFSSILTGIDNLVERLPLLRSMGDHYILIMKRK